MPDHPNVSVKVTFNWSLVANVTSLEKFATCPIVPVDEALNIAALWTAVCAPDAVYVCSTTDVFVEAVCVFVVASALANPLVDISVSNTVEDAVSLLLFQLILLQSRILWFLHLY